MALCLLAAVSWILIAGLGSLPANASPSQGPIISAARDFQGPIISAARDLLPASVKRAGVIHDYSQLPYPPMEFYPPGTHTPEGVDIDIIHALAAALGVKATITNVLFSDLYPALQTGRAEFVISGDTDQPAKRNDFEFIDYFRTFRRILTTKANAEKYHITNFRALCGKSVATGNGGEPSVELTALSQKYCGSTTSVHHVVSSTSNAQEYLDVAEGRAVAVFDPGIEVVKYFLSHQKGVPDSGQWEAVGPSYYPSDYGIVLLKHSQYEPAFMAALKGIMSDGVYDRILRKWNLLSAAVSKATLNSGPVVPS